MGFHSPLIRPAIYWGGSFGGGTLGSHDDSCSCLSFSSWWLNHPSEKYAQVKLDHFPKFRGKNKKT